MVGASQVLPASMTSVMSLSGSTNVHQSGRARAHNFIDEEAILDEVHAMLLLTGPSKLTMAEVARETGYSRATLYRRWSNVHYVVNAVWNREARRIAAEAFAIATSDVNYPNNRERVIAASMSVVQSTRNSPLTRSLIEHEPEYFLPYLIQRPSQSVVHYIDVARDVLTFASRDGSVRSDGHELIVEAGTVAMASLIFLAPVMSHDLAAMDAAFARFLGDLLRPPASDAASTPPPPNRRRSTAPTRKRTN